MVIMFISLEKEYLNEGRFFFLAGKLNRFPYKATKFMLYDRCNTQLTNNP